MATTRLQLFKDILLGLGDFVQLTATATGKTTTFISTTDMLYGDGGLNGREVWYATSAGAGSAANKWTRRVVTDTDEDTGTITVSPAWSAAPIANDVVILANSRATGVTIPEIHHKIDELIRRVAGEMAIEAADTAAEFASTSPKINIPTAWEWFLGIQIEKDSTLTNVWDCLPAAAYRVDKWDSPKTVTILDRFRPICHGKRLRLIGANELSTMTDDTTTTTAPAPWLVKTAVYELLEAAYARAGDIASALTYGELVRAQAAEMHAYVGKRFSACGRRVDLRT